ncbi:MAG: metallophosphoesterase family protein [Cetobacterium sp.]|uniref:metallophosphoesterase family protein n=1 Tax=Cetobacterium sp. TaxID=2071632 RepID=UPI003F3216DC
MKILAVSDESTLERYSPEMLKDMFREVELIVSCGDVSNRYLDYLFTILNKELVYVNGNHIYAPDHDISFCKNIDAGENCNVKGIKIVGFDGSQKYSMGNHQYSEKDVFFMVMKSYMKTVFKTVDLVISHSPIGGINEGNDPIHKGFKSYRKAVDLLKPKYWLHGHVHLKSHHEIQEAELETTKIINVFGYKVLDLDFS